MDLLLSFLVLFGILALAFVYIFKVIDQRYPKALFLLWDRGTITLKAMRLNGTVIVTDNIFRLMTGNVTQHGDIRDLEYYTYLNKKVRIYIGYLRYDYIVPLKYGEGKEVPITKIVYDKSDKVQMGNSIVVPFRVKTNTDPHMQEHIVNGQAICTRFIEVIEQTDEITKAQSPLMNMLITSLPALLIILAFGVVTLLVIQNFATVLDKGAQALIQLKS